MLDIAAPAVMVTREERTLLYVTPQASPLGATLVEETNATASPRNNVTGAAGSIQMLDVDNTANMVAVYLKIYDNGAPSVGTTPADWVFKIPAASRRILGCVEGLTFVTACSFAVVTGADQGNAASPGSPVIVRILAG